MQHLLVVSMAIAAAAQSLPPLDTQALANGFAAALAADRVDALEAIAAGGRAEEGPWRSARGVIDRYTELRLAKPTTARVVRADAKGTLLEVTFTGSAVTTGARHQVAVPGVWRLLAVPTSEGWRLAAAATLERELAEQVAAKDAEAIEAAIAADRRLDLHLFLIELADAAADTIVPPSQEMPRGLTWALAKSREIGDTNAECVALQMISFVQVQYQGDPPGAVATAEQALAIAQKAGDADAESRSYFAAGVARWMGGDIAGAVATLQESGRNIERVRDPRSVQRAFYMAALLESLAGRSRSALRIAREHERLLQRLPSTRGELDGQFLAASLQSQLGNNDAAARSYREAIRLGGALGDSRAVAIARYDLATIENEAGRKEAARDMLAQAIAELTGSDVSYATSFYTSLAALQMELGDLTGAQRSLDDALQLARSLRLAAIEHDVLAWQSQLLLRKGEVAAALRAATAATEPYVEPSGQEYLPVQRFRPQLALGQALQAQGRAAEAESAYRSALAAVEDSPRETATDPVALRGDGSAEPYRHLAALLAVQGRAAEALAIADRMRAQALRRVLERGYVDLSAQLSPAEREREGELDGRLTELNRELQGAVDDASRQRLVIARDEARTALQLFRFELYALHPSLSQRRAELPKEPAPSWQRAVPTGGAALEWLVNDDSTLGLLVRRDKDGEVEVSSRTIELPAAVLASHVERLTTLLARRDPAVNAPASELYRLLLAPFEGDLEGVERLVVIPDGVLWKVPFESLRQGSGQLLVDRLAIFRAPFLGALAGVPDRVRDTSPMRLLALGDPTTAGGHEGTGAAAATVAMPPRLPAAQREVEALAQLYGPAASEVFVGPAASERRLKERVAQADVIHLATHGLLDDRAPLFSALTLAAAAGDGEDGLLEVREIVDLDLRGRLVILSACESGAGRFREGEGQVGMAWALMAAGSPAAIVSDWRVDSEATAQLMVELHRRLLRGDGPAVALRGAQQALRRDPRYAHPYYWAGFSVLGAGW